jgi:cobalt-zinc-cadmium efflux system protein
MTGEHHDHHHDHDGHEHGHGGHDHGHGHHHHHAPPAGFDRAFAIGAILNTGFVIAEIGFGFRANSTALLADAAHNVGDVLGLLLSWAAVLLSRRAPTPRRTYGFGRSSILASLVNAVILLIGVGALALEAVERLIAPEPVVAGTVVWVALAGILVNGFSAWLFAAGRHGDMNVRAAFSHMAADAVVSAGVVVAALIIGFTGWRWVDPVTGLAIAALITLSTWRLLRDSLDLALDVVPGSIKERDVEDYLSAVPGVVEVHDLHIWALSTTETALTAHLVRPGHAPEDSLLHKIADELRERFGIGHATLQLEAGSEGEICRLAPSHVI